MMEDGVKPERVSPRSGIVVYLAMSGRASEACAFYANAFAGINMQSMPFSDGQPGLMHAQIEVNGDLVMMTDSRMLADASSSESQPLTHFGHLQLNVADGRAWWDRAVAAGCQVIAPYERQFWGDHWGLLEDPFGLRWAILQNGLES